jgi:Kef-type K+ transport system membrane component KefB
LFVLVWVVLGFAYRLLGPAGSQPKSYGSYVEPVASAFGIAALLTIPSAAIVSYVSAALTQDRKRLAVVALWVLFVAEVTVFILLLAQPGPCDGC